MLKALSYLYRQKEKRRYRCVWPCRSFQFVLQIMQNIWMNHVGSSMFHDSQPLQAGGSLCEPTGECAAAGICNMQAQTIIWRIRQGMVGTMPISSSWLTLIASFGHAKLSRCLADNQDSQKSCRLRKQLQSLLSERISKAECSWLGSASYINRITSSNV